MTPPAASPTVSMEQAVLSVSTPPVAAARAFPGAAFQTVALAGLRLRLRPWEPSDLPVLNNWRMDPAFYDYLFEFSPKSLAHQLSELNQVTGQDNEINFVAVPLEDPTTPWGTISLAHIDWRNRKADIVRLLMGAPEARGHGMGREMMLLMLDYAFDHLNLNKISLDVFVDNVPAVRLYESLGFQKEGVLEEHVFQRGRFRDVVRMRLFQREYRCWRLAQGL